MAFNRTRAFATAATLALCVAFGAPAFADDAGTASAARGKQALAAGDNAAAYGAYLKAHKAAPANRDYLHNAAALAAALGKTDEAASLFQSALAQAAKAGAKADVAAYAAEVTKLREAPPAWAEQKTAQVSALREGQDGTVGLWDRMHKASLRAATAGDLEKALKAGTQALTVARDNFGPTHMATIVSLSDLAQVQGNANQPAEAEANWAAALEAAGKALGDGHPETLKIRRALADHYLARAEGERAEKELAEEAKAAAAALGDGHGLTLSARARLASAMIDNSRNAEALALLGPVCKSYGTAYGESHPATLNCLMLQARAARMAGTLAAANAPMDKALALAGRVLEEGEPAAAALFIEGAELRLAQGRAAEAQTLLEGVLAKATDAAVQTRAKGVLVDVLDARGNYAAAETMAAELVEVQTKTLGASHPNTVAALTSLASLYRKEGRLADAEKVFRDAYQRFETVLGPDHRSTIVAANNLGEILEKSGLYDEAEPFLREASDGTRKVLGDAHPATMISTNNLALLYEGQGDFEKAESLYNGAIAAASRALGDKHPDTLAVVNNLAYLLMLKQDWAAAQPLFARVIDGWSELYGADHPNTLKARNSLARVLHRSGQLDAAEKTFGEVLAARRKVLGAGHMDVLRSQIDLASLYLTENRPAEARDLLERTLAGAEKALGPQHPYTFETLNGLAAARESIGDLDGALKVRRLTFERRNEFLARMLYVTGDNAREGYVRLFQPELAAYADLLTRMDPDTAGRGLLEISLNRKGLLFKVASELAQIGRLSRDPAMAKISDQLAERRKKMASLTLSGPTEETKGRHLEVLAELQDQVNRLQGDLGRASARFRKSTRAITADELAVSLSEDGALVDFVQFTSQGKSRLVAATLRKDGGKPVYGVVSYGDVAAIDAAILKYRKDIQNEELELDEVQDSGSSAYKLIWKPLEPALNGRTNAYVVPDGTLNILPFAALVDKGKYLIEKIDLHVYTTSRNLLPSAQAPAKGGYIINAGPDYNTDEVAGKDQLDQAKSRSAGVSGVRDAMRGMASGMRGLRFDPLPGAEKEGQLIRQSVAAKGAENAIYTRRDAQEKVLRELAEPPEILHIATHGFFLKPDDTLRKRLLKLQRSADVQLPPPGDNPLLRSGLAFAGINANAQVLGEIDTDNDGVLTALEVLALNLSGTKLAILSACETGLGEIHEGEGVYGLRRAFQEAGASTVVSSLWEVSDAGTQKLMTSLYSRLLQGKNPHLALREAQMEMLRIGEWSSPYIWSAFFMVDG